MSSLTILTFGGFEVRRGDRRVADFESWRTRALAAFLVTQRGRFFARERLASLLWPDLDPDTGRRNLRQALYNLRSTLEDPDDPPFLVSDGGRVRFELREAWLDLEPFERALAARPGDGEPTALAEAVRLYRGDFLAGLEVGGGLELEEWLLQEQERCREAVVAALRALVDHYLATGGYSVGVHHARRLLALEPLSEETHRKLMRLYALSGRRSRALAQYDELRELLARELEVEPLAETAALYRELREGSVAVPAPPPRLDPVGPVVPLAGRLRELGRLREAWNAVVRGRGRVTLVEGEEGLGKTRLIRAAFHHLAAGDRATVLLARFFETSPPTPFSGLRLALDGVLGHEAEATGRLLEEAPERDLRVLARISPRLRDLVPQLRTAGDGPAPAPEELAETLARSLPLLGRRRRADAPPGPAILHLDDLHHADPDSLAVLDALVPRIGEEPVWLVLTSLPPPPGEGGTGAPPIPIDEADRVRLEPLPRPALEEIATALVGAADAPELAELLERQGEGRPLLCSELVNLLWDLGVLEPRGSGWALTQPVAEAAAFPAATLDEVVEARFGHLPPSARRLLSLAAVAGPRFDVASLAAVEGEDEGVVEATLRLLIRRWWVRLHLSYWADSRRDRDLTLWTGHGRGSSFEFGHEAVRRAVYRLLDPERRRALHEKVLTALARRARPDAEAEAARHREAVRALTAR